MCALRRVEGEHANAQAIGILVPPTPQTIVIVRPRSLPWDLLLVRSAEDLRFWEVDRTEAHLLAQRLCRALEACIPEPSSNSRDVTRVEVEPIPIPDSGSLHVQVRVGPFVLLSCRRAPGQPYQPEAFEATDAQGLADQLQHVLSPPPEADQQIYFNTRHFRAPDAEGTS